jgi:hypothetical protein
MGIVALMRVAAGLLSKLEPFFNTMREFHDRTGQA